MFSRSWTLAILCCVALITASAAGQVLRRGGEMPDVPGREANQGVYVRDSRGAVEKLALAQRMERLKEWDKAADVYQEIIEKYADRIVALPDDGTSTPRYANVTTVVQQRLTKWPTEALAAYHKRFEPPATRSEERRVG